MLEVAGYKFRTRHDVEIMAAIADGEPIAAIASREGLSLKALYCRRDNFERVTGKKLKRNDQRFKTEPATIEASPA